MNVIFSIAIATHSLRLQASGLVHAFRTHGIILRPLGLSQRKPWRIRRSGHPNAFVPSYSSSGTVFEDFDTPLSGRLSAYAHHLKRHRMQQNTISAKSLSYFLRDSPLVDTNYDSDLTANLEHTLIMAIRTAGEAGDYRLILELVESSVQFANGNPILSPRIFGEALTSLSQTKANTSKLKHIWTLATSSKNILTHPLTAFELNVCMKALAKLGRVRSSIDMFVKHTDESSGYVHIIPDAYTASTLFTILRESVSSGQKNDKEICPRARRTNSTLRSKLNGLPKSPSWQWTTAVALLDNFDFNGFRWNNHAYYALLKLHEKVASTFSEHANGSEITVAILDDMDKHSVLPDEMTCSLVVKCIGDPSGNRMAWRRSIEFLRRMLSEEDLPMPNAFTYSAAIVSCARCSEYEAALDLLEEMNGGSTERLSLSSLTYTVPEPNTWVYNAVLLAINDHKKSRQRQFPERKASRTTMGRVELAMKVFGQMKNELKSGKEDARPDTVTYNTVLSIMGTESPPPENSVVSLLDEMVQNEIPRDAITYRNAILASPSGERTRRLLLRCLHDDVLITRSLETLEGKASTALTFIFNSALSTAASRGSQKDFSDTCTLMQERNVKPSDDTISHIITIVGTTGNSYLLPQMLAALGEDINFSEFHDELQTKIGIALGRGWLPRLSDTHYQEATSACLFQGNIADAHRAIGAMKRKGIVPSVECAEGFAVAYARAAIKDEVYQTPKMSPNQLAERAYRIASAISGPSPATVKNVAKACATTEQWWMAQSLLRSLQRMVASENHRFWNAKAVLCDLQSSLLRECAHQGNVTAALWLVRDIQNFAATQTHSNSSTVVPCDHDLAFDDGIALEHSGVQMSALNWVSVIKAARKSGHWRVCVNTLQFLRPHVAKTNPSESRTQDDVSQWNDYKKLVPAIVHATACLEVRSQYAWAVRVVKDWVSWSGRKAPSRAVLSVVRALSARGRGDEVKDLFSEIINNPSILENKEEGDTQQELLYSGACTALHWNGLYDDADEIYVSGVSNGYLGFSFFPSEEAMVLDLHGLNVALAHSAVRVAMRQLTTMPEEQQKRNVMIITGRGRNSKFHLRPVLRPEVQRMLLEEFYPPLNTVSVPGNMGALLVDANDVARWQEHQEGQKLARMLAVAAVIKDLSSNRLRNTIALSIEAKKKNPD